MPAWRSSAVTMFRFFLEHEPDIRGQQSLFYNIDMFAGDNDHSFRVQFRSSLNYSLEHGHAQTLWSTLGREDFILLP